MELNIFTDGGSRGNPGPAAIGVAIFDQKHQPIDSLSRCIGRATNNQAEYQALIDALHWLINHQPKYSNLTICHFFLDSQLVVNQINGVWKIKHKDMITLANQVHQLIHQLKPKLDFTAIPRIKNKTADSLVNLALDNPTLK